jgi:hypothetical protein
MIFTVGFFIVVAPFFINVWGVLRDFFTQPWGGRFEKVLSLIGKKGGFVALKRATITENRYN